MESKDDRHKSKRSKMRHYKKGIPQARSVHQKPVADGNIDAYNTRGVVDVADSSDDLYNYSFNRWVRPQGQVSDQDLDLDENFDNEQLNAADFEFLQKLPSNVGGHFQFSSEKNWDIDETLDKSNASKYFTLNLKLLNSGIQTIPLYKRIDGIIDFSKVQIKRMDKEADEAEKVYLELLHSANKKNETATAKTNESPSKENIDKQTILSSHGDDELDELLNNVKTGLNIEYAATVNVPKSPPKIALENTNELNTNNPAGIQDWLDQVLEE